MVRGRLVRWPAASLRALDGQCPEIVLEIEHHPASHIPGCAFEVELAVDLRVSDLAQEVSTHSHVAGEGAFG